MTPEEYRTALESLTPAQRTAFQDAWVPWAAGSVDDMVLFFVEASNPKQFEKQAIFHLRRVGVANLLSEADKQSAIATRAAIATEVSAGAAAGSARSAAWSLAANFFLALIALATIFAELFGACWQRSR